MDSVHVTNLVAAGGIYQSLWTLALPTVGLAACVTLALPTELPGHVSGRDFSEGGVMKRLQNVWYANEANHFLV